MVFLLFFPLFFSVLLHLVLSSFLLILFQFFSIRHFFLLFFTSESSFFSFSYQNLCCSSLFLSSIFFPQFSFKSTWKNSLWSSTQLFVSVDFNGYSAFPLPCLLLQFPPSRLLLSLPVFSLEIPGTQHVFHGHRVRFNEFSLEFCATFCLWRFKFITLLLLSTPSISLSLSPCLFFLDSRHTVCDLWLHFLWDSVQLYVSCNFHQLSKVREKADQCFAASSNEATSNNAQTPKLSERGPGKFGKSAIEIIANKAKQNRNAREGKFAATLKIPACSSARPRPPSFPA